MPVPAPPKAMNIPLDQATKSAGFPPSIGWDGPCLRMSAAVKKQERGIWGRRSPEFFERARFEKFNSPSNMAGDVSFSSSFHGLPHSPAHFRLRHANRSIEYDHMRLAARPRPAPSPDDSRTLILRNCHGRRHCTPLMGHRCRGGRQPPMLAANLALHPTM